MYLFDFDGTLVDSNGVWVEIDNGFLARRGLTPTREYSDTVGHSIFPIAAQFTKDYYCLDMTPEAIMAEWLDMARDAYARQVPMKPGAEAFLARCAAAGEPMALLTACVPELCRAALARHRLEGYFRQIIFVQELGLEKRNPEEERPSPLIAPALISYTDVKHSNVVAMTIRCLAYKRTAGSVV